MNLFEIMRGAGGGEFFPSMARQYGMSEDDFGKAVAAFLPAFSAGLKEKTSDPLGLMQFMRRLASAEYLRAYSNPEWAATTGRASGEDALSFLFGGPEAWRALVGQAGTFPGVPQDKLDEIFPSLAAVIFGGLAKQATAANPMLAAMLKQFQGRAPGTAAPKGPLDRYEAEQDRSAENDFLETQNEMMRAGLTAFQAGTAAWQKAMGEAMNAADPGRTERPQAGASGRDVFGEMFEPGIRLSEAYRREMDAVLERLRPATKRS